MRCVAGLELRLETGMGRTVYEAAGSLHLMEMDLYKVASTVKSFFRGLPSLLFSSQDLFL